MFDKFSALGKSVYAMLAWKYSHHHRRYLSYLARNQKYTCQECGGGGGEIEVVIPETGDGPWMECGFCEGTGYVTSWMRGRWLSFKRQEKLKRALKCQTK